VNNNKTIIQMSLTVANNKTQGVTDNPPHPRWQWTVDRWSKKHKKSTLVVSGNDYTRSTTTEYETQYTSSDLCSI